MNLRVFYSSASSEHDPREFYRRGKSIPHPESAERFHALRAAVERADYSLVPAADAGSGPLQAIHTAGYLHFLEEGWNRRDEIDAQLEELLTTQFARPQMHRLPDSLLGQIGYYTSDTSTPLRAGTWRSIYGSAQCAIAAADAAITDRFAYALCRPPGHHAYADSACGFCYINNTAVAAERLRSALDDRIAVLDIDVHHGNGTQGIFFERADVLTVSIHANPGNFFPYYTGYADEIGIGPGLGYNLNLPLPHGRGDPVFLAAVDQAIARIADYRPAGLVIALGLDASEHDPYGVTQVTNAGFARAAEAIAGLRMPTAIVQEGGYVGPALGQNLVTFLGQYEKARGSS